MLGEKTTLRERTSGGESAILEGGPASVKEKGGEKAGDRRGKRGSERAVEMGEDRRRGVEEISKRGPISSAEILKAVLAGKGNPGKASARQRKRCKIFAQIKAPEVVRFWKKSAEEP
jgi:hypothetical protein